MNDIPVDIVVQVIELLEKTREKGNRIFIFGNGGSSATASHFAADLAKSTIHMGKPRFKAFSLTDNVHLLSAWAEDTNYSDVFSEQLDNFLERGDVAIAINVFGNSQSVLNGFIS